MIPQGFAQDWEDHWNSHDLPRILGHYTEDVVFSSRKAVPLTGSGTLRGKRALASYWQAALENQPDLRFKTTRVFVGHDILVITYTNHRNIKAAETLHFNDAGLVWQASASHAET